MKSSANGGKGLHQAQNAVYTAVMAGILLIGQVVMSGLPNIEPVSLLVIQFTLFRPKLARWAIAVFVILEGVLYGFGIWWFSYLYIWYILHFLTLFTRKMAGPLFCALLSGAFGLFFGILTSPFYLFVGGIGGWIAYVVSGIPFDLLHCVGNFFLMLVLFTPLRRLFLFLDGKLAG